MAVKVQIEKSPWVFDLETTELAWDIGKEIIKFKKPTLDVKEGAKPEQVIDLLQAEEVVTIHCELTKHTLSGASSLFDVIRKLKQLVTGGSEVPGTDLVVSFKVMNQAEKPEDVEMLINWESAYITKMSIRLSPEASEDSKGVPEIATCTLAIRRAELVTK